MVRTKSAFNFVGDGDYQCRIYEEKCSSVIEDIAKFLALALVVVFFPLLMFLCFLKIQEYERAVILF